MRHKRRRQGGFTLRELMIAVSLCSVITTITVGTVHQAFRWSSTNHRRLTDDQTYFNLASQLRRHIHECDRVISTDESNDTTSLRLHLVDGSTVEYAVDEQTIKFAQLRDEQVVASEQFRWRIPRHSHFDWDITNNEVGLDITTVTPFAVSQTPVWRSFRATCGIRVRYLNQELDS
ncbi:prepilin-type N-terminal cleavage/methylation domain-containing protein [Rhodopirellula baltica]|nr:prepilin-type N-terminal cleavage/methylation domain-containing protein [Rhodopirellula baltica]